MLLDNYVIAFIYIVTFYDFFQRLTSSKGKCTLLSSFLRLNCDIL